LHHASHRLLPFLPFALIGQQPLAVEALQPLLLVRPGIHQRGFCIDQLRAGGFAEQSGQVLAYTEGSKKHYPAFQFKNNAVVPEVAKLVKETGVELDARHFNVLVGFLGVDMDFSSPSESPNNQPRYTLLSDEAAFGIIVRDYKNRLEMGT
jgi:hypothetical protein